MFSMTIMTWYRFLNVSQAQLKSEESEAVASSKCQGPRRIHNTALILRTPNTQLPLLDIFYKLTRQVRDTSWSRRNNTTLGRLRRY
jgi:hypothetical protein